jgi:hypothetical protein
MVSPDRIQKYWIGEYHKEKKEISIIRDGKYAKIDAIVLEESSKFGHKENLAYVCKDEILSPHLTTMDSSFQNLDESIRDAIQHKQNLELTKELLSKMDDEYLRTEVRIILEREKYSKRKKSAGEKR